MHRAFAYLLGLGLLSLAPGTAHALDPYANRGQNSESTWYGGGMPSAPRVGQPACAECGVTGATTWYHHRSSCSSYRAGQGSSSGSSSGGSSYSGSSGGHKPRGYTPSQQMQLETASMLGTALGNMLADALGTSPAAKAREQAALAEAQRLEAERQAKLRALIARHKAEEAEARRRGTAAWEACKARHQQERQLAAAWEAERVARLMDKYKLVPGERPNTLAFRDLDEYGRMKPLPMKPVGEPFEPMSSTLTSGRRTFEWKEEASPPPNTVAWKEPDRPAGDVAGDASGDASVVDLSGAGDHPAPGLLRGPDAAEPPDSVATLGSRIEAFRWAKPAALGPEEGGAGGAPGGAPGSARPATPEPRKPTLKRIGRDRPGEEAARPLGRPVPPPPDYVDDRGWVAKLPEAIHAAAVERTEWVRTIRDCLQSRTPMAASLGGKDLKRLQPGDVLVVTPDGAGANLIALADVFYSGRINLPPDRRPPVVSHTLTFVGRDASGKSLFLDHTPSLLGLEGIGGSRLISEAEYLQTYGRRQQYVASPLLPRQGKELMKYALEAAKKTGDGPGLGTDYGAFGKDVVCSERSRLAVGVATGLDLPTAHGGPVDMTPSDFLDQDRARKYWVITPLN